MLDDFVIRAMLAGIGLSLATGPLGAFVVWRRMAYFGDATAHAAILGVAIALAFSLPITAGVLLVALAMAITVSVLSEKGNAMDSTLGVLAHSALALGLVAVSYISGVRVDLQSFLFGDILTVTRGDLLGIWGGALLVLIGLVWRWAPLLTTTLNTDLAVASGVNPRRERMVLTVAVAVVVAVSIKVVGALLISAMLIIPAAAARGLARSPEGMAVGAVLIGMVASIGGMMASLQFDTPAGPSIVVVAALLFAGSIGVSGRR